MAVPRADASSAVVRAALTGKRKSRGEWLFEVSLLLALLLGLAVLVTLLADVWSEGASVIQERRFDFLTSNLSSLPERAGVRQGLIGSLMLMGFVVALALPLGIAAAIYMEEYASDTRFSRFINANIRNLAGVPAIVYGILGLVVFVVFLEDITGGRSLMSGGITMAILVLPIVIITAAEAIRTVPSGIREAGYGVGATRWEVIRSHILPYAAPGIFTGTILTLSRAIGETAPLLMIGAVTGFFSTPSAGFTDTLQGPYTALPTVIYTWARRSQTAFGDNTAAAILVLMALLLAINAIAILLRNRYERKW
ncbi:MAG: phosphate ABC transporter permease PstA [Actinomycetota bacterium]